MPFISNIPVYTTGWACVSTRERHDEFQLVVSREFQVSKAVERYDVELEELAEEEEVECALSEVPFRCGGKTTSK